MIRFPNHVQNFNFFEDGVGYAGLAKNCTLPNVTLQTERYRGSGMDAGSPVDMGMEDMTASVVMAQWIPRLTTLIGNRNRFTLRPTEKSNAGDFDAQAFIFTLGGLWSGNEFPEIEPGSTDLNHTITCQLDYLRLVYRGQELMEIDIRAGKRVINGTDQMAAMRAAMGF